MKNKHPLRLRRPHVVIVALVAAVLLGGIYFYQKDQSSVPKEANKFFSTVLADSPKLPGTTVWSDQKDHTVKPSSAGSIEPHGGYVTRTLIRASTADATTAQQQYQELSDFMKSTKKLAGSGDSSYSTFVTEGQDNAVGLAEVFVLSSQEDLPKISFLLKENPEFGQALNQHFSQSQQPVYGYAISATYTYN